MDSIRLALEELEAAPAPRLLAAHPDTFKKFKDEFEKLLGPQRYKFSNIEILQSKVCPRYDKDGNEVIWIIPRVPMPMAVEFVTAKLADYPALEEEDSKGEL